MKKMMRKTVSLLCVISMLAACVVCVFAVPASAADEFDYSGVTNETWLYDFKSGTGTDSTMPAFLKAHPTKGSNGDDLNYVFTYKSDLPSGGKESNVDENGLHYYSYYKDSGYGIDTNQGTSWMRGFYLWDADVARQNAGVKAYSNANFGDGSKRNTFLDTATDANLYVTYGMWSDIANTTGFVPVKDGLYAVTVKFKVSDMNAATNKIFVGVGVANYDWSGNLDWSLSTTNYLLECATVSEVMDDWATLTVIVDGTKFKGTGNNYLKIGVANDTYVHDGSTYNQVDFEYISVERYYDSINGEFGVRFYDADNTKGVTNIDNAEINDKTYILGSGGGSPEQTFQFPEPKNDNDKRYFKLWKAKNGYNYPSLKEPWDNGFGGYTGDYYTVSSLNYSRIRYFEATYVTEQAPSSTDPVVYKWDLETMYRNKRTLGDGIMVSGDIGTENTIAYSMKYTEDGLSFRSNGGGDKMPEKHEGKDYSGSQRISFYTGLAENKGGWSGNYVRFKYGYTYKFSMVYKVDGVDANGAQIGLASLANDEYGGYKWGPTRVVKSWTSKVDTNGWVHVTCFFVADEFAANNIATMAVNTNAGVITIKEATLEESYGDVNGDVSSIYFRDNSPTTPNPFIGFVGDTHGTLPIPENFGYEFVEWCTDKNLTQKYEGTTFPEKDITLYAKWKIVPTVYTFDKVNLEGSGTVASTTFTQDKEGDNNVIKYSLTSKDYEADPDLSEYGTYRRISLNDGNWNHHSITPGVEYTVTLRYKVLSSEEGGSIAIGTSRKFLIWSNYIEKQGDISQKYGEPSKEWKTMEFKFIAKVDTSDPRITDTNHLMICMNGKAVVLIDDVIVTPGEARANYYGNVIRFNTGDGEKISPICGDEGDAVTLPTPKRDGYAFGGWFTDAEFTTAYTAKTFGATDITVYAQWLLGKYTEGFEKYPEADKMLNFSSGWVFNDKTMGGDAANVRSGKVSLQRNPSTAGARGFSILRSNDNMLTTGQQYTLTFYIKPTEVTDVMGVINLLHMSSATSSNTPRETEAICNYEKLKVGEWNKVDFVFTAKAPCVGISMGGGNNVYLDDFTITLKGYNGVATGEDTTMLDISILVMVVIALGALTVTGVCVFKKVKR